MCLLVAGAQAEADDAAQIAGAESLKSVFLPTTPNDYGGMIYSLLQEQSSRIANKDGAQVTATPFHVAALHACTSCTPHPVYCDTPLQVSVGPGSCDECCVMPFYSVLIK